MSSLLSYLDSGFVINGRYRIERRIGAGGFAVVFEGFDLQIDRRVAIKVLHIGVSGEDEEVHKTLIERFNREAKLAARVEHPNVVSIYDFGTIDGHKQPFIVMELLKGYDLEHQIYRKGVMKPEYLLPLYIDCLTALGVAHSFNIVHKDLKPSNLFLKNPGERLEALCIVDFGIAYISEAARERLTQDGQLLGTPSYLTPEYITNRTVSPALDVYQMALIFIEALLGEPIVEHPEHLAAMLKHVRGDLQVPRSLLESPIGAVLRRALAYDANDRYADALEFADALSKIDASTVPIPTRDEPRDPVNMAPPEMTGGQSPSGSQPKADSQPVQIRAAAVSTQAAPSVRGDVGALVLNEGEAPGASSPNNSRGLMGGILVLFALLVLAGIGVLAFVLLSNPNASVEGKNNSVVELATQPEKDDPLKGALAGNVGAPNLPVDEKPVEEVVEKPVVVDVMLTSVPANAMVFQGDHEMGLTPLKVSFASDDEAARTLRLSLNGFQDLEVVVEPENAPEITKHLVPQKVEVAPIKSVTSSPKKPAKQQPAPKKEDPTKILLPNF